MMQDPLDAPVAGSGESVALVVAAGGVDRCGAVPTGESTAVREATHVADIAQNPGRAGRTDAIKRAQTGPGRVQKLGQLFVGRGHLAIERRQVRDQLCGELPSGSAHHIAWTHRGQQDTCLGGGQELLGASGDQLGEQLVQPVDGVGAGPTEFVATVDQQP